MISKKTKKRKPASIAFRMLLLMIIFISFIFSLIFVSFNFLIEDYVRRDISNQLAMAIEDINKNRDSIIANTPHIGVFRNGSYEVWIDPEIVYRSFLRYLKTESSTSEVNTIIYSSTDYRRSYPDSENEMLLNLGEMDNLLGIIGENTYSDYSKEQSIYKASAAFGNYYIATVDLAPLFGLTGLSAAFYVSAAKYDNFADNTYAVLMFILIIALIFTILYVLFISKSISRPIKKLCGFADEIGRGNFGRNEYYFLDRELIDLNARMNETAEKLEKNDENQKTFFQNVSHELKTPLMSIRGYAEGIKYKVFESGGDLENATDIIIAESDRLNGLVSDLLYISKMDAASGSATLENASLPDLIKSCVEKLSGLLIDKSKNQEKKIEITGAAGDIYISCDEENLIRALMNVIANCVQYAASYVQISFWETDKKVFLSIFDDGPGISPKDLPNIFKRFYKGEAGKHGIGLSIAKSIIEQHGGKISAQNRPGDAGAEFIIEFNKIFL